MMWRRERRKKHRNYWRDSGDIKKPRRMSELPKQNFKLPPEQQAIGNKRSYPSGKFVEFETSMP